MSAAPNWHAMSRRLELLRDCARAEKKAHGHVLPQTAQAMVEALAATEAAIVIDDAKEQACN